MLNFITRSIAILLVTATLSTTAVAEQLQSILDRGEVAIGVPENFPHSDLLERILNMKDMMLT